MTHGITKESLHANGLHRDWLISSDRDERHETIPFMKLQIENNLGERAFAYQEWLLIIFMQQFTIPGLI